MASPYWNSPIKEISKPVFVGTLVSLCCVIVLGVNVFPHQDS